ncbi:reverse transcriptase [Cucumis melo var. makuwa]|uniref:Reverse transcriptase n=1 Tax=Cucumis melo var. makuwa TaxID=1194695 RepID=A0A5D3CTB4_CUCMM|nr:reverse transcriptase [Cucumis melo var. makuwa]
MLTKPYLPFAKTDQCKITLFCISPALAMTTAVAPSSEQSLKPPFFPLPILSLLSLIVIFNPYISIQLYCHHNPLMETLVETYTVKTRLVNHPPTTEVNSLLRQQASRNNRVFLITYRLVVNIKFCTGSRFLLNPTSLPNHLPLIHRNVWGPYGSLSLGENVGLLPLLMIIPAHLVSVHSHGPSHTKFAPPAQSCVFVGSRRERTARSDETLANTQCETSPDDSNKPESYDPSLDMPIALRKGTRSCTKHSMCNYMSYSNLSRKITVFTASLGTATIPNIHEAMESPKWKTAVMEEIGALKKIRHGIFETFLGHKRVGCKWSCKYLLGSSVVSFFGRRRKTWTLSFGNVSALALFESYFFGCFVCVSPSTEYQEYDRGVPSQSATWRRNRGERDTSATRSLDRYYVSFWDSISKTFCNYSIDSLSLS